MKTRELALCSKLSVILPSVTKVQTAGISMAGGRVSYKGEMAYLAIKIKRNLYLQ